MISSLLLIDDDENLHPYIDYIAKQTSLVEHVYWAKDGLEGLDFIANKSAPDLILLDINMPNMNGLGFLEKFNQQHHEKKPVIAAMLTVSVPLKDKEVMEKSGVFFIKKPIKVEDLKHLILEHFPDQKAG